METYISRVGFLIILVCLTIQSCERTLPEKPNIVFITTDYHAWEDVPELTPALKMPALDKLYKEGLVFENHYCTAPVCMPSRYTIVSGTYPHTHSMWDNGPGWLPEGSPVLMEELVEAGYKTIGIGKMHFKPWDRMAGFTERIIADCQGNWSGDTTKHDDYYYYLKKAGVTRFDYLRYQDSTDLFGVYYWPLADTLDIDYYVGEQTVSYIENDNLPETPWFMWVSFNGPHNPWDPPQEYMDYYLERELPLARFKEDNLKGKPYAHTITRYNYTRKVVDRIDAYPEKRDEYIHRIRAGHYGGLTWIDAQMQRIFDKLEEKGKLDNTIIIFTSDHGAQLGDHDLIHKGTLYERSSHVPFVIWWPEAIKPGSLKGYTSHIDLFPTFMDLAGGELPEGLEGDSYYNVLAKKDDAPDRAVIEILGNTAVVTKDYKFGLYRQFKEGDLYDRKRDPDEYDNVYDDPQYSEVVKELTSYLYAVDPTLKEGFENAPEPDSLPSSVVLEQGATVSGRQCPYFGGSAFRVSLRFTYNKYMEGPLLSHYEGQHAFSVYIDNGMLMTGFRKWNNDEIFEISGLNKGSYDLLLEMGHDGKVLVRLNNNPACEWHTQWPLPIQPGRQEYLSGSLNCGHAGTRWNKPVGEYLPESEYKGIIEHCDIKLTR